MENLMMFEGNQVIVKEINGEPMFEIYSTGRALGFETKSKGNSYPHKIRINKVLKNAEISTVVHDVQQFITESQLYDFMLEAKTDKCKVFRKWVVTEVLPSIRKHKGYILDQETMSDLELLARANLLTQSIIAEKDALISNLTPQAQNYRLLMDTKENIDFADFVKSAKLKEGRNGFMGKLRTEKILMKGRTTPRQQYVKQGYFEVVQGIVNGHSIVKTVITKRGQDWLIKKCNDWDLIDRELYN